MSDKILGSFVFLIGMTWGFFASFFLAFLALTIQQ